MSWNTPLAGDIGRWAAQWAPSNLTTRAVVRGLLFYYRDALLYDWEIDWDKVWLGRIPEDDAMTLIALANQELDAHEQARYFDIDLAYMLDLVARIAQGTLVEEASDDLLSRSRDLIERAESVYPAVAKHSPAVDGFPVVEEIEKEIAHKRDTVSRAQERTDD